MSSLLKLRLLILLNCAYALTHLLHDVLVFCFILGCFAADCIYLCCIPLLVGASDSHIQVLFAQEKWHVLLQQPIRTYISCIKLFCPIIEGCHCVPTYTGASTATTWAQLPAVHENHACASGDCSNTARKSTSSNCKLPLPHDTPINPAFGSNVVIASSPFPVLSL